MCFAGRAASALAIGAALCGCALPRYVPPPTEAELAAIRPGMTRAEVLGRVGPPTWSFAVRKDHMTIMNYRFNRNDCIIYQIGMLPDGTVHDVGQGIDPACDPPD